MKRIEVKILGLSYSQSQAGSYVVVLSEIKGNKKLPLIIKPNDAQQIALKVEGLKSPRPLTHDLFKLMTDAFDIDIQEVYIYSVLEGIFYAKIISSNGIDNIELECSVGDALALSLVYGCSIFVSKQVIDVAGVVINDDGSIPAHDPDNDLDEPIVAPKKEKNKKRVVSIEDLEYMMADAIKNEEYEIAAGIRDRIQDLKDK